jgi:DNA-binding IclR family transcriptional regulator
VNDNLEIKNKSIEKAVKVLNCFTKKSELGVSEISEQLGLYKSNVHNILRTLKELDYIEQDEGTGKYRLGIGIFALSRALGDSYFITKIAMPYLQELSNITNERVYLGVGHEDEVLYLESFYPTESFNLMRSLLGERAKMYCTGIGKAMLAFLQDDLIEEYISKELISYTNYTITDKEVLRRELAEIRARGYSIDNMEHEYGIKCVAAPIFDKSHKVYAAVSISGPSLRFDEVRIKELSELLKSYVNKIEKRIL